MEPLLSREPNSLLIPDNLVSWSKMFCRSIRILTHSLTMHVLFHPFRISRGRTHSLVIVLFNKSALCGSCYKFSFDGNTFICFKIRGFTIKEQHTLPCALRLGKNSSEKNTSRCSALWVLKMPPHSSKPFTIPLPFFRGGLKGVFTLRLRILITPTKIKSWYKMTVDIFLTFTL